MVNSCLNAWKRAIQGLKDSVWLAFGSTWLVHAGSLYVIPPKEVEFWIQEFTCNPSSKTDSRITIGSDKARNSLPETDTEDISQDLRKELRAFVKSYDEDGSLVRLYRKLKRDPEDILESNLQNWLFGDELPIGLKLTKSSENWS